MEKDCLVFTTVLIGQTEGLPNITGTYTTWGGLVQSRTGAFEKYGDSIKASEYSGGDDTSPRVIFDASLGETKTNGTLKTGSEHKVYGSSDHVTPYNATIKVWQRIS